MVVEIRFFKHTFSPYFPSALLKITENNTFPLLQHVYTTTKLAFALLNTVFKEYVTAVILKLSFLLLFLHVSPFQILKFVDIIGYIAWT